MKPATDAGYFVHAQASFSHQIIDFEHQLDSLRNCPRSVNSAGAAAVLLAS
ncbi:MAG TPA: hypothetical protein VFB39_06530 [Solirubrobacteraceae bacterium]|nr:hypothetical protein [Solirubrobacteraceae bacterium]